jgi:hypothetical protein
MRTTADMIRVHRDRLLLSLGRYHDALASDFPGDGAVAPVHLKAAAEYATVLSALILLEERERGQ